MLLQPQQQTTDVQISNPTRKLLQPNQITTQAPDTQPFQEGPQLHDTGNFLGNLANSAGNFIKNTGEGLLNVFNPNLQKNTVVNLGKAAFGAGENLAATVTGGPRPTDQAAQIATQIGHYYKQRYGSLDNFLTTLKQDPVGTAADASVLLDGLGTIASTAGEASKIGALSEAGKSLSTAGEVINPVNAITKPLNAATSSLSGVQDWLTQQGLKLKPQEVQNLTDSGKLPQIIDVANNTPGLSNSTKAAHLQDLTDLMKENRDQVLTSVPATTLKSDIVNQINTAANNPSGTLTLEEQSQLRNIAKKMNKSYSEELTSEFLNNQKIAYGKKSYMPIFGDVTNNVKSVVSNVFKTATEQLLEKTNTTIPVPQEVQAVTGAPETLPIQDYNQIYGRLIDTKELLSKSLKKASKLEVMKNEGIGAGIGFALGHGPVGTILGGVAGKVITDQLPHSSALTNAIGETATKLSKVKVPNVKVPTAASRLQSATRPKQ